MSISFLSIASLGLLISLFLFWIRLKEDYTSNIVFTFFFYLLFGGMIGSKIIGLLFPGWWFWGGILGTSVGYILGIYKYRINFFETLEASGVSLGVFLGFIFLSDSIVNTSVTSLVGGLVILLLVYLFFVLDKRYKSFSWYKSGRLGLSGLTMIGSFFLIRAVVALFFPSVLTLVVSGKFIEVVLSSILSFISFGTIFFLANS